MQLKVFQPGSTPGELQVIGESQLEPVVGGANTFQTRIPVKAGDLIGSTGIALEGSSSIFGVYCTERPASDKIGVIEGAPGVGASVTLAAEQSGLGSPVTAVIEPDADGDGFGDETQDKCPTDASTQGDCPVRTAPPPPVTTAPITLSASAVARKGLVTVTLTSSAQATVTVGGSVKIGKAKTAKLSASTQIVAPGSLAKFTILFPAKLRTALKRTPSSKRLTLNLAASAPGATTANLTVKVPGQKKPAGSRHHGKT